MSTFDFVPCCVLSRCVEASGGRGALPRTRDTAQGTVGTNLWSSELLKTSGRFAGLPSFAKQRAHEQRRTNETCLYFWPK